MHENNIFNRHSILARAVKTDYLIQFGLV